MNVDTIATLRLIPTSVDVPFMVNRAIADQLPRFIDLVPFKSAVAITVGEVGEHYIYRLEDATGRMQSNARYLTDEEVAFLTSIGSSIGAARGSELYQLLGPDWVSWNRFTYVGPRSAGAQLVHLLPEQLLQWANAVMIPAFERINRERMKSSGHVQLSVDVAKIAESLWVLECINPVRQGTAFVVAGIGMITCHHVLGPETVAFQFQNPSRRLPVNVLKSNHVVDLAIIGIEQLLSAGLQQADSEEVKIFSPISIAGFPNYRIGDSPRFVTGSVAGFRMQSGIRRVLLDAPIVAGNSGGPVCNSSGDVIGIAVTGADNDSAIAETENHSFIPIGALALL